jgi:hypothetical protein
MRVVSVMRSVVVASLLSVAVVGGAADAAGPPSRYEDEPWVLLRVSPSGRVLVVQARGGGCGRDPRATVTERPGTVEIRMQQRVPADPETVCPLIARIDTMRVRLRSPIAGRRLVRQSLRSAEGRPTTMPRVLGLRVRDARFALRAQGFRVRGDRGGTVRAQRPRPLTPLASQPVTATQAGRVTLANRRSP